jgi:hypothetical protein
MTENLEAQALRLHGLYAGQCQPEEYEHLIAAGLLRKSWEGLGGLMGMSKLVLVTPPTAR